MIQPGRRRGGGIRRKVGLADHEIRCRPVGGWNLVIDQHPIIVPIRDEHLAVGTDRHMHVFVESHGGVSPSRHSGCRKQNRPGPARRPGAPWHLAESY